MIDSVSYMYGFTVDDTQVLEEWLYSYPARRRRLLFARSRQEFKFGGKLGEPKPKIDALRELTRRNTLFVTAAGALLPVYQWFRSLNFPGDFQVSVEHRLLRLLENGSELGSMSTNTSRNRRMP